MDFITVLHKKGIETIPAAFYTYIDTWESWYRGNVKNFHRYRIFNGQKRLIRDRYSMGMGKKVAEDWANLLMNEKVHITLEGKAEQEFFNRVCTENNFAVKMSEMQEMKAALGTVAYIPSVKGMPVNERGEITGVGEGIKLDYVTADRIFPIAWDNGIIRDCAFATEITVEGKKYCYVQIHRRDASGKYRIENCLYNADNDTLKEVELSTLPLFAAVPAIFYTGSEERQFVIDRLNIANNIDIRLPMGISVYANAIDQLKGIDITYDSYVNEYVLGKKRIMVKPEATKNYDGEPIFDPDDIAFYVLPEDSQTGTTITEINSDIRAEQHSTGMQDALNALSAKCGFGESHYKWDSGSIATATQVISQNSTLFRTLKKHEIILEEVLTELTRIILRLGNTYLGLRLNEDVEISIDFDDSIIEDKAADFERDARLLGMGIMQAYEFRMKWMNEDEATAKAALPHMEELVSSDVT